MGSGHFGFDSDEVQEALGMGQASLQILGESSFSGDGKNPATLAIADEPNDDETKKLEEERAAAKAERLEKARQKRAQKPFDEQAHRTILDPEFQLLGETLMKNVSEASQNASQTISMMENGSEQLARLYANSKATLVFRVHCLRKAAGLKHTAGDSCDFEFDHPTADKVMEFQKNIVMWKQGQGFTSQQPSSGEPFAAFVADDVKSLPLVLSELPTYTIRNDDDIKEVRKAKKSLAAAFQECINKVKEHRNRLASAYTKKNDQLQSRVEAQQKEDEDKQRREQAKLEAKRKLAASAQPVARSAEIKLFGHWNGTGSVDIVKVAIGGIRQHMLDHPGRPFIVETEHKAIPSSLSEMFKTFVGKFKQSGQYTGSGRGTLDINTQNGVCKSLVAPVMNEVNFASLIDNHLTRPQKDFINLGSLFGYAENMKASGPEHGFVTSVKLQLQGSRHVVVASFKKLLEYAQCCARTSMGTATVRQVCDYLAEVLHNVFLFCFV